MDITIQLKDILNRAKERFESDSNENLFEQSLQEFKKKWLNLELLNIEVIIFGR